MTTKWITDIGEDLSRYRYHTGATLRPLAPDEPCRILFRDIGPWAMAQFLRGQLKRLAGPFAPILYTRTAGYHEPYIDYEPVGRLAFLQPQMLRPWYSGVPTIFVASLRQLIDPQTVGFVPAHVELTEAERKLQGATDIAALRESLGQQCYDDAVAESLATLDRVNIEHAKSEKWAEPIRRRLQSRNRAESEWAKEWLAAHRLSESDLCATWHHLPRERRAQLLESMRELGEARKC